jgi:hypothetical protein
MTIPSPNPGLILRLQNRKLDLESKIATCKNIVLEYGALKCLLERELTELILAKDENDEYILTPGYSHKEKNVND